MGRPSPESVSTKRQRIAMLAKKMPGVALTSLAHHIDIEWMKEAFRRTRKDGAVGVDGQTAKDYEAALEANFFIVGGSDCRLTVVPPDAADGGVAAFSGLRDTARKDGIGSVGPEEEKGGGSSVGAPKPPGVQSIHTSGLSTEQYIAQQAWKSASLDVCPFHPDSGCRPTGHGSYGRAEPAGCRSQGGACCHRGSRGRG